MILAIDTSGSTSGVAVYDGRVLSETSWRGGRNQSSALIRVIDQSLELAGVERTAITAVALASGPGSYSGLRVGASTAIGLGLSLGIEIIHVPTLEILAVGSGWPDASVRAAIEVGRGRYASALFRKAQDGSQQTGEVESFDLGGLLSRAEREGATLVGDFDPVLLAEALANRAGPPEVASPAAAIRRAGFLAELAAHRLVSGQPAGAPGQLIYLPN